MGLISADVLSGSGTLVVVVRVGRDVLVRQRNGERRVVRVVAVL